MRERVPHLIVGWGPEVTALLGEHPDIETCIAKWADVPPHDAYVLLSTLPQIFGTTLDAIPWPGPYMTMKPARIEHWRQRLYAACKPATGGVRRPRVGIAWSGRPTHPNNTRRSIRLEVMAPILANTDIDFIVLQKPFPEKTAPTPPPCRTCISSAMSWRALPKPAPLSPVWTWCWPWIPPSSISPAPWASGLGAGPQPRRLALDGRAGRQSLVSLAPAFPAGDAERVAAGHGSRC